MGASHLPAPEGVPPRQQMSPSPCSPAVPVMAEGGHGAGPRLRLLFLALRGRLLSSANGSDFDLCAQIKSPQIKSPSFPSCPYLLAGLILFSRPWACMSMLILLIQMNRYNFFYLVRVFGCRELLPRNRTESWKEN